MLSLLMVAVSAVTTCLTQSQSAFGPVNSAATADSDLLLLQSQESIGGIIRLTGMQVCTFNSGSLEGLTATITKYDSASGVVLSTTSL